MYAFVGMAYGHRYRVHGCCYYHVVFQSLTRVRGNSNTDAIHSPICGVATIKRGWPKSKGRRDQRGLRFAFLKIAKLVIENDESMNLLLFYLFVLFLVS